MNYSLPDYNMIDSILKRIYEANKQKYDQLKINTLMNKPLKILDPSKYTIVTMYPIDYNTLTKSKNKLDIQLINTLSNLISLYKESGNPCILNELELVLEEYIDAQQERFDT